MRIQVLQENFHRGISKCSRLVNNRPQIPILAYVHIETGEGFIRATSTNAETTIQTSIPAKVIEGGSVCVQAKLLFDLISTFSKTTLDIYLEGDNLVLVAGRGRAKVPCLPGAEFPEQKTAQKSDGVVLGKDDLFKKLTQVIFSASTDDSRPVLGCVRVESSEEGTNLVATDGYRLSLDVLKNTKILNDTAGVPARSLYEVIRLCAEEKAEKDILVNETVEGQITFTLGETTVFTRKIDGEYPNYRKIIPQKYNTKAVVDLEGFIQAVKSAALFAKDNAGIIKLNVSEEGILVSANTPSVGENQVLVECEIEGEGVEVAINSRFLMDLLQNISTKELDIELTGSLNPVVFKNPANPSYMHIIMPVRVQG